MTKRSQPRTDQVKCHVDGSQWGEYVTAGETYTVTWPRTRKGDAHFWNTTRNAGTFMRFHQAVRAIERGFVEIITEPGSMESAGAQSA
jgi:hypothetical protein